MKVLVFLPDSSLPQQKSTPEPKLDLYVLPNCSQIGSRRSENEFM